MASGGRGLHGVSDPPGPDGLFSQVSNHTLLPYACVANSLCVQGGIKASSKGKAAYEPVFPVGFYTNWGGYLEGNDTSVEVLAKQGCVLRPLLPMNAN